MQRTIQKLTPFTVGVLSLMVLSCGRPSEENVTQVKNGAYTVEVRSQEFHHSGVRNVDICVADIGSSKFPKDKGQCFLHGFDFSGLTVKWLSERNVEIFFACGRVSRFSNFAVIANGHLPPVEFHATLDDECNVTPGRALQTSVNLLANTRRKANAEAVKINALRPYLERQLET